MSQENVMLWARLLVVTLGRRPVAAVNVSAGPREVLPRGGGAALAGVAMKCKPASTCSSLNTGEGMYTCKFKDWNEVKGRSYSRAYVTFMSGSIWSPAEHA